jgi:putative flippase GtrA
MSSSPSSEGNRILRFLSSGVANTLAGFAVIFGLMALGVGPIMANVAGYATGLALSFVLSRRFVFSSAGTLHSEAMRFLLAFFAAFAVNLTVLQLLVGALNLQPYVAQVVSAAAYTLVMYVLSRWFVFRQTPTARPGRS